jgi:N6-adenosine-specific RNA methylase IME4
MSGKTLEKAKKVVAAARESPKKYQKVKDEMDETGNVDRAYQKMTSAEKRERMTETPLPEGKFNVIYADPPWKYEFAQSGNREVGKEYPTMELDDICKIAVPAADDAILLLWVTVPKLREGMKVVEAWGFEYKTGMVWVKGGKIGMGYYVRSKHELLLIATRGKFGPPAEDCRPESIIIADRGKHSEKPAVVYELIEKMYPGHKYIELFARSKRDGWTSWGNEN